MARQQHGIGRTLERFSTMVTRWTGGTSAFAVACAVIVIWAAAGPLFGYSDTWQLVINTGTTIRDAPCAQARTGQTGRIQAATRSRISSMTAF